VSIAGRLGITFAVMIALILTVGTLGLARMQQLNDATIRIAEERFGKVRRAQEGVRKIDDNARVALHLFTVANLGDFDRQLERQRETSRAITELYQVFEQQLDTDEERELFARIKEARGRYTSVRAQAEEALRAGKRSDAQGLVDNAVLPRLDDYIDAWNQLLDYESQRMEAARRDAEEGYARARALTIGLIALAAGLGAFVAVFMTRRITRPILEIARAARHLERGERAPQVRVTSTDEVGALARAFNVMGEAVVFRQERLEREMSLAHRIQTALLPRDLRVPAFELAAAMKPATEVGGDYYDVLPVHEGWWLGIGDVAGHGLDSGLVMLMIQSSVATLVRQNPDLAPRSVVTVVNRVIQENLRERLERTSHATLVLLRLRQNGQIVFAGAHEDVLVCRAGTGRCEAIETPGTWIGGASDIEAATIDSTLRLDDGDLLVLFTDGLTEARNAEGVMFGVDRLRQAVERAAEEPVDVLRERIFDDVAAWAKDMDDDRSVVVARYRRPVGLAS
jgi:serine phosphatase RsbU (regulator of sigma subunit)